jgi:plasmid stabilization system protein ParE
LARRDLKEIWGWIAADNERHADRFLDSIAGQFATLENFPKLGKPRPELLPAF